MEVSQILLPKEMIERADRIFVFSKHNREKLVEHFPSAEVKIELFCKRSVSDWNVNPAEIFEQDILPAVRHWDPLLKRGRIEIYKRKPEIRINAPEQTGLCLICPFVVLG
jgi:predicted protein tyrosine phosphatase